MNGAALQDRRPLVVHLVYRFDTGGLENGVVNLINHMPAAAYRHAVVALTALGGAIAELTGRAIDIGAGVAAAEAVIRG